MTSGAMVTRVLGTATQRCAQSMLRTLMLLALAVATVSLCNASVPTPIAKKSYNVPAGPLGRALATFAAGAGVTLSFDPAITTGKTSSGLRGEYTLREGFERLLAGTGLLVIERSNGGYILERRSLDTAEDDSLLSPVQVASLPYGYSVPRTVTATRTDTPLRDVPQSVTVIPQQLIRDASMQNIADVLRYVPGIGMAQGEGNREAPILRGNTSTSDFYIDGIRDDLQYFRDLYNIDRVEALKGASGMVFGRGGSGGVINRVGKTATWDPVHELILQGGSYGNRRISIDAGQGLNERVAVRLNAMYEHSDSYRDGVELERRGINPTLSLRPDDATLITLGYEYFKDERTDDRGVSSFRGEPVKTDPSTFFGDPDQSPTHAIVKTFNALVEHRFAGGVLLRSQTRHTDYDKFYQNVFPGAVNAQGTSVNIMAYNSATQRQALFNQTDLTFALATGAIEHKFVAGFELGRQVTDNFRNWGYFIPSGDMSITVPLDDPTTHVPVAFQHSSTDADNHGVAKVAALYVQDQVALSPRLSAIVGARYDRFRVDLRNNNNGAEFDSDDELVSPRLGLIFKPVEPLSLYASYSLSYLPRAGDQLSSLSATNAALDPEKFTNYEIGAKWDIHPALAFTAALYRLQRSNVAVVDPLPGNATRQTLLDGDAQRSQGVELGINGQLTSAWSVFGGYAYQDGELTQTQSATLLKGARLAGLPRHTLSLWNKYELNPRWGVGLGVIYRSDMLAVTENKANPASDVTLAGYTRVDGALFFQVNEHLRAQLNIENLFDTEYHVFAHSNTNITPGSPRAARVTLIANY